MHQPPSVEVRPRPAHARRRPPADFYLVAVGVMAIAAIVIPTAADGYDNDIWFILASGRQIVERGFPATNPWAVYQGLGIVIQQWVPDVLAYACHAAAGWWGLSLLLLATCCVLAAALYHLGRAASPAARPETIVLASALALLGLESYISFRPQVYTMIFMCLTLAVMERYRRDRRPAGLLWLLPIELAHTNFHASMAPIDIAIVGAYLLPDLRSGWERLKGWVARHGHLSYADGSPVFGERWLHARTWALADARYPRLPLLASMAAMALLMLANPYGPDGALYLVHSIGAAGYGNYIEEMKALMPTTATFGIVFVAVAALGLVLVGGRGTLRIDLPLTLCVLVLSYLGLEHVRNVWLVVPFVYALLLKAVPRLPFLPSRLVRPTRGMRVGVCCLAAVLVCALLWSGAQTAKDPTRDSANTPIEGVDAIDVLVPEAERSQTGVFCTFEEGGYLEWRGYKVSMDARPELWEPAITGVSEHYYQDYVDMMNGSRSVGDMLERAGCRYVIAGASSKVNSYLQASDDYVCLRPGTLYQVWRRV